MDKKPSFCYTFFIKRTSAALLCGRKECLFPMKRRILSALCAFSLVLPLCTAARAETYSVTLTAKEAASDVPVALSIPAQTPAGAGEAANRIVISAPAAHAAVEIPVSGDAAQADLFYQKADGTYAAADNVIEGSGTLCLMLPEKTAMVLVLKKMPFSDVKRTSWYYSSAAYVYHNALMNGTGENTFSPNGTVSRATIALILWRLAGEPVPAGTAAFSDVAAGKYFTEAVLWCAEEGIMGGAGDKFLPNGNLSREQLALVLYRFCETTGRDTAVRADLSKFADSDKVSAGAQEALSWAVGCGVLSGTAQNALNPAGTLTRSELATILMRFCAGSF